MAQPKAKKPLKNAAFVYIKPPLDDSIQLVRTKLTEHNIKIIFECTISGNQIDRQNIVDKHYYSLASKALSILPQDLSSRVSVTKFRKVFGEPWHRAIGDGRVYNAKQVCEKLKICTAEELYIAWNEADQNKKVIKIGNGCYCGEVNLNTMDNNNKSMYVINGFYPYKRLNYTSPDSSVRAFVIEWNSNKLSWKDFRTNVIGDNDPLQAVDCSIRKILLDSYTKFGLTDPPTKYNNVVHASASPFEALSERCNWLGRRIIDDEFGKALLHKGITETELTEWMRDNRYVPLPPGGQQLGSVFDYLKDKDCDDCVDKIVDICDVELKVARESGDGCCSMM